MISPFLNAYGWEDLVLPLVKLTPWAWISFT